MLGVVEVSRELTSTHSIAVTPFALSGELPVFADRPPKACLCVSVLLG
jgi:hypothetical protein